MRFNWSKSLASYLYSLCRENYDVIESKKSDSKAWKDKDDKWADILRHVDARSKIDNPESNLKKSNCVDKWSVHKKAVKVYADKKRAMARSTGNLISSEDPADDPEIEKTNALIKKDISPIGYSGDSDKDSTALKTKKRAFPSDDEEITVLNTSTQQITSTPQIKLAKTSLDFRKIEHEERMNILAEQKQQNREFHAARMQFLESLLPQNCAEISPDVQKALEDFNAFNY